MEAVSHRVEEATKATQKLMENVLDDSELTTVMTAEQRRSLEEPLRAQGIKKPHLIHWLGLIPGSDPSVGVDEGGCDVLNEALHWIRENLLSKLSKVYSGRDRTA